MKRPSFQWYPGDHRRDVGVQACSFEARALQRELLDLMHDGEPYGHLTAGGVPIQTENLARMVGVSVAKIRRWLKELEDHKVFSKTDTGVIYSRRMVRDEHNRQVRAAGGVKSLENPSVPRPKDTSKDGAKDTFRPSSRRSFDPSPASAVASASASARNPHSGEGPNLRVKGERLYAEILAHKVTNATPSGTRSHIPKEFIETLAPPAQRAFQSIGGSAAAIEAEGDATGRRVLQGRFGEHYELECCSE